MVSLFYLFLTKEGEREGNCFFPNTIQTRQNVNSQKGASDKRYSWSKGIWQHSSFPLRSLGIVKQLAISIKSPSVLDLRLDWTREEWQKIIQALSEVFGDQLSNYAPRRLISLKYYFLLEGPPFAKPFLAPLAWGGACFVPSFVSGNSPSKLILIAAPHPLLVSARTCHRRAW